ncbi:TfoX/Sxy family protein [Ideonella sp. 4Y16]|uniref:TfoX/Sxy family protein n=1 Tax=Ideonella alba TaxID=2824118 RepID=UPI001B384DF2|nr:TfoX/Sxy family protein [Ideonella alba]MBQ0946055.1 TfoX/Sxy family protein [Ideonella alba]
MTPDKAFVNWCTELLAPLGAVRSRRMFGGHGLYVDELFVALIMREVLYLKVDDATQPRFEAASCRRFEYVTAQGEHGALRYFSAPDEAMDAPSQMQPWGRLALEAALRAQAAKAPKAPQARRSGAPRSAKPRRPTPS